jgi:hypothetical protein
VFASSAIVVFAFGAPCDVALTPIVRNVFNCT